VLNLIFLHGLNLNHQKIYIFLLSLLGLFNLMHSSTETKAEMYIRQASPDSYRQVLRAIRQKEIYKIIVDTNPSNIKTFFRSVRRLFHLNYHISIVITLLYQKHLSKIFLNYDKSSLYNGS